MCIRDSAEPVDRYTDCSQLQICAAADQRCFREPLVGRPTWLTAEPGQRFHAQDPAGVKVGDRLEHHGQGVAGEEGIHLCDAPEAVSYTHLTLPTILRV